VPNHIMFIRKSSLMLHYNVHKFRSSLSSEGFTLLELMTVVVIVGILSAIATPSVLSQQANTKLNYSLELLKTSLELSQAEAIKTSRTCEVNIPDGHLITTTCSAGFSNNIADLDQDITISSSGLVSPQKISYSFRGVTTANATITLTSSNTSLQKCLVVSPVVGLIRTGNIRSGVCVK
jgi:prepilin-type N-terminal cleavage/methylation domain-containing protein